MFGLSSEFHLAYFMIQNDLQLNIQKAVYLALTFYTWLKIFQEDSTLSAKSKHFIKGNTYVLLIT